PAVSVSVAVKLWALFVRAAVVKLHIPLVSATVVPILVVPSNTLTVLLVSAVPVSSTSFVFTTASLTITGAPGATVSTVTASAAEIALVLPPTSVSVAVRLWAPSLSAAVMKLHVPLAAAVAVPRTVAPSNNLIVLLASAVPVNVRVLSLVMWSPTTPLSVENEAMAGATGAVVSIVTLSATEATLVLPAASVSVAVKLWTPLVRAAVM